MCDVTDTALTCVRYHPPTNTSGKHPFNENIRRRATRGGRNQIIRFYKRMSTILLLHIAYMLQCVIVVHTGRSPDATPTRRIYIRSSINMSHLGPTAIHTNTESRTTNECIVVVKSIYADFIMHIERRYDVFLVGIEENGMGLWPTQWLQTTFCFANFQSY